METPNNFDFPFPPYDIQLEFMKKLYYTLEHRKLGIFESPTGTGKSLSIICGAIKWLKDKQIYDKELISEKISSLMEDKLKLKDSTDWISKQSKEIEIDYKLMSLKKEESRILEYEEKMVNIKKLKDKKKFKGKSNLKDTDFGTDLEENNEMEDDLIPDEINLNSTDNLSDENDEEGDDKIYEPLKIYICSRTHSQLDQFLKEIVKSPFGNNIRVVSLASRQTFCINPNVTNLKNMALINDRCLDLQKKVPKPKRDEDGRVVKKSKGSCNCPYYKPNLIEDLSNQALSEILDIEDLVQTSKIFKACPYYASRKAAKDAEIILVPYNTILHKATREANGVTLKNNIVIIDEAHNLLEALAQMYNSELNYTQIFHALQQLKAYRDRFKSKFSPDNLLNINQIIFIVNKLHKMLERFSSKETSIFTLIKFVSEAEIDRYNMFKLTKFCKDSRLAQKLRSYSLKYPIEEPKPVQKSGLEGIKDFLTQLQSQKKESQKNKTAGSTAKKSQCSKTSNEQQNHQIKNDEKKIIPLVGNPLLAVISFLECLTYSFEDGRILITKSKDQTDCKFQFLLLKPSQHFSDIVKEARSVIVAGGTMSPMAEFRDRLFINAGASPDRIVEFSCDHIISQQNILPLIIHKGLDNETLLFNYEKRMTMINSIKNILLEVCQIVPGGVVVFFPSYEYENSVHQQLLNVNFGKQLFREPKTSSQVDSVLQSYAKCIKRPNSKGALLFSVVGGKLSEGLNFSDELGRCVIVIGMPYSNINAVDLKEKMNYLDKTEGLGAGKTFYENQCMKAVNQCIGRAIRHRNDYATMILLDQRYTRKSTENALPGWIKKSLKTCDYKEALNLITKFFKDKSIQNQN